MAVSSARQIRSPATLTVSIAGLLVSACLERAPEGLIGAAVSDVGVHDLLKVRPTHPDLLSLLTMACDIFL